MRCKDAVQLPVFWRQWIASRSLLLPCTHYNGYHAQRQSPIDTIGSALQLLVGELAQTVGCYLDNLLASGNPLSLPPLVLTVNRLAQRINRAVRISERERAKRDVTAI